MHSRNEEPKPPVWRGTSKADFMAFPRTAQREMGYGLFLAQIGERHPTMATLKGFGGGNVIESGKATTVMRIVPSIRCATLTPFTCFMHSRRNPRRAKRRRNVTSI